MGVGDKMPNREEIINIINETRRVIFPGFFGPENTALVNLNSFAGTTLASIYENF